MKHYPDIESWTDLKLGDTLAAIFQDGYEVEQEPKESRSEWTRNYLRSLHEKKAEIHAEINRRTQPKEDA